MPLTQICFVYSSYIIYIHKKKVPNWSTEQFPIKLISVLYPFPDPPTPDLLAILRDSCHHFPNSQPSISTLDSNVQKWCWWRKLLEGERNDTFIYFLKCTVRCFKSLCEIVAPVIREKVLDRISRNIVERKRLSTCPCIEDIVGLTLMYLNSTQEQNVFCIIFSMTPSVVSEKIIFGLHALVGVLQDNPTAPRRWQTLRRRTTDCLLRRVPEGSLVSDSALANLALLRWRTTDCLLA